MSDDESDDDDIFGGNFVIADIDIDESEDNSIENNKSCYEIYINALITDDESAITLLQSTEKSESLLIVNEITLNVIQGDYASAISSINFYLFIKSRISSGLDFFDIYEI